MHDLSNNGDPKLKLKSNKCIQAEKSNVREREREKYCVYPLKSTKIENVDPVTKFIKHNHLENNRNMRQRQTGRGSATESGWQG